MSLPTGNYRAVLLFAKKHRPEQRFYTLEFSLVESGERDRAIVLYKDMPLVFSPAAFIMREGTIWSPFDPLAPRPIVNLSLNYSPKYQSTRAIAAARTGETVACDIKAPIKLSYDEF